MIWTRIVNQTIIGPFKIDDKVQENSANYCDLWTRLSLHGGARGVMVIVVGNGHGDTSSNPGRD